MCVKRHAGQGVWADWPGAIRSPRESSRRRVLGRLVQQLTNAFAEHGLTFLVHSSAHPARPVREIWKSVTPAAVLALHDFPESEAEAMRAAGTEVVMAMHGFG